MQQDWDDLDKIIIASQKKIEPRMNYNHSLISKIRERKAVKKEKPIAALSLITAGFLLIFLQVVEVPSQVINVEYQVKTGMTLLENDLASNNLFVERDNYGKEK